MKILLGSRLLNFELSVTSRIESPKNRGLEEAERSCQKYNSVTESRTLRHSPVEKLSPLLTVITRSCFPLSAASSHPLLANMTATTACTTPGTGQAWHLEKTGGDPAVSGGFPKKLAGSHRAPSATPRNVPPRPSQDKEYQSPLAPGLVLTLQPHYRLLFLWPHSPLPTSSTRKLGLYVGGA